MLRYNFLQATITDAGVQPGNSSWHCSNDSYVFDKNQRKCIASEYIIIVYDLYIVYIVNAIEYFICTYLTLVSGNVNFFMNWYRWT